jgi:putative hydrolase of the HAD superfamily
VLSTLGLLPLFDGVFSVEDMTMFGHLRPKPDARMLRHLAARLGVPPQRACWWRTRWNTRRPHAAWA